MSLTWTLEGALKRTAENQKAVTLRSINVPIATEEESSFRLQVPTGTVDQAVQLGFINAQMLAIFTDDDISIKLASGGTDIQIGGDGCLIIMVTDVDELLISNSSGNIASVQIYVGGAPITP